MPPTETGHMCISRQTAISKGPLGVRRCWVFSSCRLQSDNENTVLKHLVFPADPRVAFALYSAFKLLHKNNLFVRSLSVSSLTQIRGPRGEGNTRVGGCGLESQERRQSVVWSVDPQSLWKIAWECWASCFSPCFSARRQGYTIS